MSRRQLIGLGDQVFGVELISSAGLRLVHTGGRERKATVHHMPDAPPRPNQPDIPSVAIELLDDIEASPSPYHAVQRAADILTRSGFIETDLKSALSSEPGPSFVVAGGALVAWILPANPPDGFCIVGAHTDSPNLRLRTNADVTSAGWAQVGVEVYGGVLLNSWLDRDLGVAGRVTVRTPDGPSERLIRDDRPLLRVPQLAIHLDREIREKGLLLNPQDHLTPVWATGSSEKGDVLHHVAGLADVEPDAVLAWELMAFDTQPPALVGRDSEFLASARIDNQLSCFAATHSLAKLAGGGGGAGAGDGRARAGRRVPVLVLYDHEEIGSTSATGASGVFLSSLLERISAAAGADRIQHLESMTRSYVVSADGAHATHPNYVDRHEPNHHVAVNAGVVVKRNANQRYATDATSEAFFRTVCASADVPLQTYIHRNDLPCGSTIGPVTAAELAIPTVDVGAPQLAMHSIREMAGVFDVAHLANALHAAWSVTDL